jgi:hypothetical protein
MAAYDLAIIFRKIQEIVRPPPLIGIPFRLYGIPFHAIFWCNLGAYQLSFLSEEG